MTDGGSGGEREAGSRRAEEQGSGGGHRHLAVLKLVDHLLHLRPYAVAGHLHLWHAAPASVKRPCTCIRCRRLSSPADCSGTTSVAACSTRGREI